MSWLINGRCGPFQLAVWSCALWCCFWTVLCPVWQDIEQHFNWFLFVNLHLKSVPEALVMFYQLAWYLLTTICITGGVRKCFEYIQSKNKFALRFVEVIEWTVVMYNVVLLIALLVKGQALLTLFRISLPLQLAFLLYHTWFLLLLPPPLALILYIAICCFGLINRTLINYLRRNRAKSGYLNEVFQSPFLQMVLFDVLLLLYYFIVWLGIGVTVHWVCQACPQRGSPLPHKPSLSAHRGCAFLAPENTLHAYQKSLDFPQVVILETDIQISRDGHLFLLHDSTLLRTTDVMAKCPSVDPFTNATEFYFYSSTCPLSSLNVGHWFANNMHVEELRAASNQSVPLFADFLKLAVNSGSIILFDFKELPDNHPHALNLVNATLKAISEAGMLHEHVWWLPELGRDYVLKNYPRMIQATKTEHIPFEEFAEKRIRVVNDAWALPLGTWRKYQASSMNLTLNMFWVDTKMMLEYAWCIGIDSITTDNCQELSNHNENRLFLAVFYHYRQLSRAVEAQRESVSANVCQHLHHVLDQVFLPAVLCVGTICVVLIAYLSKYEMKLRANGDYLQQHADK